MFNTKIARFVVSAASKPFARYKSASQVFLVRKELVNNKKLQVRFTHRGKDLEVENDNVTSKPRIINNATSHRFQDQLEEFVKQAIRSDNADNSFSALKESVKWIENFDLSRKILNDAEKEEILKNCPFYEDLSTTTKMPMNPCSGAIDYRFLEEPFYPDPVIEAMKAVPPNLGQLVFLQAVSGAGKTGAIFSYARKYFTIYTKVSHEEMADADDFPDTTYSLLNDMLASLARRVSHARLHKSQQFGAPEPEGLIVSDYVIMACQLMWLAHALVLDRARKQYPDFKPEHWLAFVMNGGRPVINTIMTQFNLWYINLIQDPTADASIPANKIGGWLRSLTENVTIAIDEAQLAQNQFPMLPIVSSQNKPRNLLSVLALYSVPATQSRIVTGTRMTDFEQFIASGESKFRLLPLKTLEFPISSPEDSINFVTQFFKNNLVANPGLRSQIGYVAQGRIRRAANLSNFIYYARPTVSSPKLEDYIKTGIEDMKLQIRKYIFGRLDKLEAKFKEVPDNYQKWRALLKELFVNSSVGHIKSSDQKCIELGINIEDLGFALVSIDKVDEKRYISIKEPFSFEVFRDWLLKSGAPYVEDFERSLRKTVGDENLASDAEKGYAFERLIAALMLQFKADKIRNLPILKGVEFGENAPTWLDKPFTHVWTRMGKSLKAPQHSPVFKSLVRILQDIKESQAVTQEQIQRALTGTILEHLFSNDKARNQQVMDALVKIMACKQGYWCELLLLLSRYEGELLLPSKYYGPDVIGFIPGGILVSAGLYIYSPDQNSVKQKQKKNKRKFSEHYLDVGDVKIAYDAVRKVSCWNELNLDIGIPRTEYNKKAEISPIQESKNVAVWVQLCEDHVAEIVHDRASFNQVLEEIHLPPEWKKTE